MAIRFRYILTSITLLVFIIVFKINFGEKIQPNTSRKLSIYRDEHGIAHVVAYKKNDLAYGIGYAEASDRLWTLFLRKKFSKGQLSSLFGPDALQFDLYWRNLGFYKIAKKNVQLLDQQTRQYAESYIQGINEYARQCKFLSFQFYLFWTQWQQMKLQDIMTQILQMGFSLQFDWMYQLARQRLRQNFGSNLAQKILAYGEKNLFRQVTIVTEQQLKQANRFNHYNTEHQQQKVNDHWNQQMKLGSINLPFTITKDIGSNAWVIGGEHTFHGKPILSNDPHLVTVIPSIFYPIQIILLNEKDQIDIRSFGAMVDGIPAISIGVNNYFAWGATASYVDNKDINYQTTREFNGKHQYLFQGIWLDFQIIQQVFHVKHGQTIKKNYYYTHRGPVLHNLFNDLHFKYGYPLPMEYKKNYTLSLTAALFQPDNSSLKGMIELSFCKTKEASQKAGGQINTPNIDSVWIDLFGNYGYASIGFIPKRQHPQMGSFIKDGNTTLHDMKQFFTYKEKLRITNPKKGYFSLANNKFAQDGFDLRASLHEITNGRAYRLNNIITQKIANKSKFSFKDMMNMQLDQYDDFVKQILPGVLKSLDTVRHIWQSPASQLYYQALLKWDYNFDKNSIEAAIYSVWQHGFQNLLLLNTNLTQQQREAIINHAFFEIYQFNIFEKMGLNNLTQEEKLVCSNIHVNNITNVHPCLANVALSFKNLPNQLHKLFKSDDIKDYRWGKIHKMKFRTVPWSDIPVLKHIWERQYEAGGNSRTVNVAIHSYQTKTYDSFASPIFRLITDANQTYFSYDTGVSDRFYSQNYDKFVGKDMYIEYIGKNPLKQKTNWKIQVNKLKENKTS